MVKHCGPDTIQLVPKEIKQDGMAKSVIVVYIENYLQTHTAMRQMQGGTQPAQQTQQQMLQAQQQQQMQQQQMRMSQQAGALSRCAVIWHQWSCSSGHVFSMIRRIADIQPSMAA